MVQEELMDIPRDQQRSMGDRGYDFDDNIIRKPEVDLIKFLMDNKTVPKSVRDHFWAFCSNTMALTNLDEKQLKILMYDFRNVKLDFMMSRPHYKLSFNEVKALSNLEALVRAHLLRSTGGVQRERFIIGAQIQQRIGGGEEEQRGGVTGGIRKIFGFRR